MQRSAQTAPKRRALRRFAPPKPLGALLVIVVAAGSAWALLVPPFQAPDEYSHFAYVQSLAESFALPNNPHGQEISQDVVVAASAEGAIRGASAPESAPPNWSRADERAYEQIESGRHPPSRSDGSGPTNASGNPPLYYLIAAVPYLIDDGGTMFGRLYSIRLLGVLILALTTLGAWLLAGEVFNRRRVPQLACAATAALLPMATFVSTAVNPDALLICTWTYALWLGARVINRGAIRRDAVALGAVTAAAVITKATSYALVGPTLLALLIGWWRRPAGERRQALPTMAMAFAALGVPIFVWVVIAGSAGAAAVTQAASSPGHPFRLLQFLNYVWQFYLPRLPFMTPYSTTPQIALYAVWIHQLTGAFGWLTVLEPLWVYPVAGRLVAAMALAAVVLLGIRLRHRRQAELLTFFGLALLALIVLLHVVAYRSIITGGGAFLQGRYLLPAVALFGLTVGLLVDQRPRGVRAGAVGLVLFGLLAWQVMSLVAVVKAFYL